MVRIALALLVSAAACGCNSVDGASAVDRAVAWINSGSGINVNTRYGGGTLGIEGQRERAERNLHGWGRPLGGIGAQREGAPRYFYGSP
jgi:hypothetical protein